MVRWAVFMALLVLVAGCQQTGTTSDPQVTGFVTYKGPIPPPNAVLEVRVVENANWPNPFVVGSHQIFDPGPSPIRFTVNYDPRQINPNRQYLLEADIIVRGRVSYTNNRPYFVLTRNYPSRNLEVPMERLR